MFSQLFSHYMFNGVVSSIVRFICKLEDKGAGETICYKLQFCILTSAPFTLLCKGPATRERYAGKITIILQQKHLRPVFVQAQHAQYFFLAYCKLRSD